MRRERLTIERIKRFTCPIGKSQSFLWDEDVQRLAVRVTAAGVKSFIFEGKLDRSTIRWTIGKVDDWIYKKDKDDRNSIEDVRIEARRLQTLLDQRIDPREQRQAKKDEKAAQQAAIEAIKKYTLETLLDAYADHLEAQGKKNSASQARSVAKVHVLNVDPILSAKPATEITSHDIAALIRQAREKGKIRTAGILRSTLHAAYNCGRRAPFDTALPSTFIKFSITSNPVDVIPTIAINAGNRTLSKEELKIYMAALGSNDLIDQALKLALFTGGQRMAQLIRAETTDWNSDNNILRLLDPKGKRSTPREHLLPLGPIAASIVSELSNQASKKETKFLFPSTRFTKLKDKKKPDEIRLIKTPIHISMFGPRVTEIAAAMGGEQFNLRDIRRTVETMLAGLGISRDIRAQLLSHGISGVQAQHYDRHDYLKEKRTTLMKWERYLTKIASGEEEKNVIQFNSKG